jgi:hypothetical protein
VKGVASKRRRRPSSASLKLTHFTEMDPSFVDVSRLEQLCPHLRHISLSIPISIDTDNNSAVYVGILTGNFNMFFKSGAKVSEDLGFESYKSEY